MLPEIFGPYDNQTYWIIALLLGAFIGSSLERLRSRVQRLMWRRRGRWKRTSRSNVTSEPWTSSSDFKASKPPDAADQLRIVMGASFTVQSLLNKSEARVFKELDRIVLACNPDWQVMAQVSLGEILQCKDIDAYSCINSKRVDLLLVDEDCLPRHAIEYQGGAHYQAAAAARDAIKKEALRRAGIGYHEVVAGHTTPSDLKRLIEKLVEKPMETR
ncbi:DUF2726 domain-containing protein [Emcibacter sp. SYSU 3D8]|uniref:DUF2726 domain-containing protein n=1 Tax=Emcibacter sp. SYSU 3D8 TaxID=3133969 RepID=UPI0031FEFC00